MKKMLLAGILAIIALAAGFSTTSHMPPTRDPPQVAVTPTPSCSTWSFKVTGQNTSNPVGNFTFTPCSADMGKRFKACFTGTELTGPHPNQTATTCIPVTVEGKCTVYTADLNADGKVDLADVATVASAFDATKGSPNYRSNIDIDTDGRISILDVACVAFYYGQAAPL